MESHAPDPATRAWVERLRATAAEEAQESIDYWRAASPERHAEVLLDLLDMTDAILRSRGRPANRPPLPPDKFPWPSMRRDDNPRA